ncbi:hypothetical protein SAMN05444166_3595 [Singulisphaera sp. GP187]|nr:hypothetical protein SAMN05444166_3595 [Singulisphaera sp. GP187]
MKLPNVRFTVRRLMVAVATFAVMLGLGLEVSRIARRYRHCHEMARRHAALAKYIQKHTSDTSHRLERLDAVLRRFARMGPEARPIDDMVVDSHDPGLTAWFVKGSRRGLLTGGEERSCSPAEFTAHIEEYWGRGWRKTAESLSHSLANHSRLREDYLHAAYRPWVRIPSGPPPQDIE